MTHLDSLPQLPPAKRLVGPWRENALNKVVAAYNEGAAIRAICARTGRSYGNVHRLLAEAGITFRRRGGVTRGKWKAA